MGTLEASDFVSARPSPETPHGYSGGSLPLFKRKIVQKISEDQYRMVRPSYVCWCLERLNMVQPLIFTKLIMGNHGKSASIPFFVDVFTIFGGKKHAPIGAFLSPRVHRCPQVLSLLASGHRAVASTASSARGRGHPLWADGRRQAVATGCNHLPEASPKHP